MYASAQGRKGRVKNRRAPPAEEARAQRPCAGAMRTLPGGNVSSAALAGFDPGVPRCVVERAARVLLANDLCAFSALAAAPLVETWILTAKRRRGARAPAARDRVQDADGPLVAQHQIGDPLLSLVASCNVLNAHGLAAAAVTALLLLV